MKQPRIRGYDILRVILICMIVVIHSSCKLLWKLESSSNSSLLMLEIYSLCVCAVPCFFILSGSLLLRANGVITQRELFSYRIKKQFIPFVLWSMIYVMLRCMYGTEIFSISAFFNLIKEPAYSQFWFMYTLLAIYLLLPFLQILTQNMNRRQFEYLLILWGIFSCITHVLNVYVPDFYISPHIDLVVCEGYLGFFLLGNYLQRYTKEITWKKASLLFILGIVITSVTVFCEWTFSDADVAMGISRACSDYLFPGAILSAIGLYTLFQNYPFKESAIAHKIASLSDLTLGVFYVHMIILTFIEKFIITNESSIILTLIKAVITIVLSFLVSYLLSIVPIINKYLVLNIHKRD